MREFQEKKHFRKLLYSKVTVGVLLVFIMILARATWNVYQKERESAANALQAQNELNKLQNRQAFLNSEINSLSSDEGVDEAIRQKFGVSKPGEQMLVIVDDATTSTTTPPVEQSLWQKFKNLFK